MLLFSDKTLKKWYLKTLSIVYQNYINVETQRQFRPNLALRRKCQSSQSFWVLVVCLGCGGAGPQGFLKNNATVPWWKVETDWPGKPGIRLAGQHYCSQAVYNLLRVSIMLLGASNNIVRNRELETIQDQLMTLCANRCNAWFVLNEA